MGFRSLGFQQKTKGLRIDNIPDTGTMTGNWGIDLYGCWWEYTLDIPSDNHKTAWIIGDYPEDYKV
jgi:hypothetical protein